jgi:DNA invertase Pin-like site-specific DNA recombinase
MSHISPDDRSSEAGPAFHDRAIGTRPGEAPVARSPKVRADHLRRLAVVYVRQSSPQQVLHNRGSAAVQYDLRHRAAELGWQPTRVLTIDDDQGQSGTTAENRPGFQRLLAEVSLDRVGIVLGAEMSRLARSCRDWHHLLETCALFDTLMADQDGVYDPGDYNDRLLLGLKGTMSEAELHMLRGRMLQARLNKARRGEVYYHPPIGYVKRPSGEFELDPDRQVQDVVRLVFDKFDELGTVGAVLRYLVRQGIRLGVRPQSGPDRGQVEWRRPSRYTLHNLLHNPTHAGAYTYGRRPVDPRRKVAGRPGTGRTTVEPSRWEVLIQDHLPAYISWDRYLANRRRLVENQARCASKGSPRRGAALLSGLLICGRCGQRMTVTYGRRDRPAYYCGRQAMNYGGPQCQRTVAAPLDEVIGREVLRVVEPASLELALQAADDMDRERGRMESHWRQQIERARYDADRAARQYHSVEPENRLVAAELERRWERAMTVQRDLQEQYERFARERPREMTDGERELLRRLSADLPRLWDAETTTAADRKAVVRQLVDRIVVSVRGASEIVEAEVHWIGGAVSSHEACRPVRGYEQLRDFALLKGRVVELRGAGRTSAQIAEALNREGFVPPRAPGSYNRAMVRQLMHRCGITRQPRREIHGGIEPGPNEWWLMDLAGELGVPDKTLRGWLMLGWILGRKIATGLRRWVLWADAEEINRLRRLREYRESSGTKGPVPVELTTPGRGGGVGPSPGE